MPSQTLAQMVRAKYPGAYDDLSDAQLESAVRAKFPGVYDDLSSTTETLGPAAQPPRDTRPSLTAGLDPDHVRKRALTNAAYLPAVAGAVGGMMGGPLGAAGGGVVGDALKQTVRRKYGEASPETMGGQVASMAKEGAIQGASEVGGRVLMKAAGKVGTFLMNRAANVSDRLAREFPNLSQTLIDHAITVTQGGYGRARAMLGQFKTQANAALRTAEGKGLAVEAQLTPEIAESFKTAVIERALKSGAAKPTPGQPLTSAMSRLNQPTRALLSSIDNAATNGTPFRLTPTQADLLKTQLQRESKTLYAAMRGPNGTPAIETERALKAEYASQLNSMIDDIADGYMAANAKAKEMLGATRAVRQAVRPGKNLYMALVRPTSGAILGSVAGAQQGQPGIGAALGAAAGTPAAMSVGAIGLGHPVVQQLIRQLPRSAAAMLTEILGRTEGSQPQTPDSTRPR